MQSNPQSPNLSVLLCTWNNSQRLAVTLDAIAQCDIPEGVRWELVVVNNNSTDSTEVVIKQFKGRLPIRYVHESKQGLSNARNAGLAVASGEWVLFTDDDVRPYPGWIAAYVQAIERHPVGYYFGGPLESEFEAHPPAAELLRHAPWSVKGLSWGDESREVTPREKFVSANWACRRDILLQVGGFNPHLGLNPDAGVIRVGEESDLMERLQESGVRPWYLPAAKLRHFVPQDKCDIKHLGDRQQAHVYFRTFRRSDFATSRFRVAGYPIRLIRKAVHLWLTWQMQKLRGVDFQETYIQWRSVQGRMEATRDYHLGKPPADSCSLGPVESPVK